MRRLKRALRGVYGHADIETAERTGVPLDRVVEVRAEDFIRIYEGKRR